MANNRMYLVHRSSGTAIGLGKRMGYGWYAHGPIEEQRMNRFFDLTLERDRIEGDQDDFAIILESDPEWSIGQTIEGEDRIYAATRSAAASGQDVP